MTFCLDVVVLLGLFVYKSRGDYLINVPLLCGTFLEFQLKNVLSNEQNYDMILRDILSLFVDGGVCVLSLYPSQGRVPAWIICWLCDGYVVHMFWVCDRYALDMLCGYVECVVIVDVGMWWWAYRPVHVTG